VLQFQTQFYFPERFNIFQRLLYWSSRAASVGV